MANKNTTTKRTRGESTNNVIRDILKKYYVSTKVFEEFVNFLSRSLNYEIPEIDIQAEKALKGKWEPWEIFDLTPFYKQYSNEATYNITNPDTPKPHGLSFDSLNRLRVLFLKEIPAKEILDNFNISYPTLKNRIDHFFIVKMTIHNIICMIIFKLQSNRYYDIINLTIKHKYQQHSLNVQERVL